MTSQITIIPLYLNTQNASSKSDDKDTYMDTNWLLNQHCGLKCKKPKVRRVFKCHF